MANLPSFFSPEIIEAIRENEALAIASPHPFLGDFPATPGNDTDPLMRALQAATAIRSADENERIPEGEPRITNQLERANYPGS